MASFLFKIRFITEKYCFFAHFLYNQMKFGCENSTRFSTKLLVQFSPKLGHDEPDFLFGIKN
jgi:hypothetical protein